MIREILLVMAVVAFGYVAGTLILSVFGPDCTHGTLPPECIWPAH